MRILVFLGKLLYSLVCLAAWVAAIIDLPDLFNNIPCDSQWSCHIAVMHGMYLIMGPMFVIAPFYIFKDKTSGIGNKLG